jgi:hypothetical protein
MFGDHVLRHANFRAEDHVRVLADCSRSGIGMSKIDVVKLGNGEAGEPDIGNVNERIETCASLCGDVATKSGKVIGASIAGRDAGGGGLMRDQFVRRNADRGAIGIYMRVDVDEARGHQLPARIKHFLRPLGRNISFYGLYRAKTNTDVASCAQVLARVEHVPAFNDEVELVVRADRGGSNVSGPGGQRE